MITPIEIPDLSDKEAVNYLEMVLEDKSQEAVEANQALPKIKKLVHGINVKVRNFFKDNQEEQAQEAVEAKGLPKIKTLVHGIKVEALQTLVEQATGGRFLLIENVARDLRNGMKLEDVKRKILLSAAKEYKTAGLLNPKPKFGEDIIYALLKSSNQRIPHGMALSTCMKLRTEKEQQACNKVVDSQVFAYHPTDDTLSFQSRATLTYAREYVQKK